MWPGLWYRLGRLPTPDAGRQSTGLVLLRLGELGVLTTTVVAVFLGPYLTAIAKKAAGCGDRTPDDTVPRHASHLLGMPVAPARSFPYTVSLSVLLTVFVLPVVGAIADRSARKKQLLAAFAYIGAGARPSHVLPDRRRYLLGAGCSSSPTSRSARQHRGLQLVPAADWPAGASATRCPAAAGRSATSAAACCCCSTWSLVTVLQCRGMTTSLMAVRVSRARPACGGPGSRCSRCCWLRNRPPSPPWRPGRGNVLTDGFRQLGHTLRALRAYPLTLFFLVAYLVYNDGIQTVITLASQYGTEELQPRDRAC